METNPEGLRRLMGVIIKYDGPTDLQHRTLLGNVHQGNIEYDGPLLWSAPARGPKAGIHSWIPLKKNNHLRMAWEAEGRPTGCFRFVRGELVKAKEPK